MKKPINNREDLPKYIKELCRRIIRHHNLRNQLLYKLMELTEIEEVVEEERLWTLDMVVIDGYTFNQKKELEKLLV